MKTGKMHSPTRANGRKYIYEVTDSETGASKKGYGDTPSDAACNCEWIVDSSMSEEESRDDYQREIDCGYGEYDKGLVFVDSIKIDEDDYVNIVVN